MYVEKEDDKENWKGSGSECDDSDKSYSGRTSSIELTDEEKLHFEEVYSNFLKKAVNWCTPEKGRGKDCFFFELREAEKRAIDIPEKVSFLTDVENKLLQKFVKSKGYRFF